MYIALKQLGYRPYHMIELLKDMKRSMPLWDEGLRAKVYGEGASFGCKEFDALLGDFDVSTLPQPLTLSLHPPTLDLGRIGHSLRPLRRRAHKSLPGRESDLDQPRRRQVDELHAWDRMESDALALLA